MKPVPSVYNDLEAQGLSLESEDSMSSWQTGEGVVQDLPQALLLAPPPLLNPPLAPSHMTSHMEVHLQWPSPDETLYVSISHAEGQLLAGELGSDYGHSLQHGQTLVRVCSDHPFGSRISGRKF